MQKFERTLHKTFLRLLEMFFAFSQEQLLHKNGGQKHVCRIKSDIMNV